MTLRASLPDLDTQTPEALKALIVAQHEQILSNDEQLLSKDEQLLRKDAQLASRDEEIERLKLLIAKLRRMQYGRKSEKLDWQIEQLELKLDELEANRAQQTAASPVSLAASDGQPRTAELDAPGFLLFHFPFCRTRPKPTGSRTASNSSCDHAQFVLASRSHEVNATTPSHQTPHTRDATTP